MTLELAETTSWFLADGEIHPLRFLFHFVEVLFIQLAIILHVAVFVAESAMFDVFGWPWLVGLVGVDLAVFDIASCPMQGAMVVVHFFRACFVGIVFLLFNWRDNHLATWDAIIVQSFFISWYPSRVLIRFWCILLLLIWTVWVMSGGKSSSATGIILTIVVGVIEIVVPILLTLHAIGGRVPLRSLKPLKDSCCFLGAASGSNSCGVDGCW